MTWSRRVFTKKQLVVAASCALVYLACWAATGQFGASVVAASVRAQHTESYVSTGSPFPFVVTVQYRCPDGAFQASYLWLGGLTHELSRESESSPFIWTLF